MTKKELYKLSVKLSGGVLGKFFNAPANNFDNMELNEGRKISRKFVYETLAPLLLTEDK